MRAVCLATGVGNVRSVVRALEHLAPGTITMTAEPAVVRAAEVLIVAGQGSFDAFADALDRDGGVLREVVLERIRSGTPYFGICLGYQILFEGSEETPDIAGFGVLRGQVRRFQEKPGLKIPHMGWNSVVPRQPDTGFWQGLGPEPYFYYVHSYFPVPADDSVIAAETTYGDDTFAAAVQQGPLLAAQFHPEKSQDAGLRLLGNFFGI